MVEINDTILYMLTANHLAHAYNSEQRFDFPDINCNSGQTLLILGSSGVGKTTLLHILAGILKPKSGDVYICLLYTSPSPRDKRQSRMPSSA